MASKCKFMLPSVKYLGNHISGEGISPTKEKRRAMVHALYLKAEIIFCGFLPCSGRHAAHQTPC